MHMSTETFNCVSAVLLTLTVVAGMATVTVYFHQLRVMQQSLLTMQDTLKVLARQGLGAAHERLYHHNLEWQKFLVQHPELRPFFYDDKPLDGSSDAERGLLLLGAEMLAGFLELIVLQYPEVPNTVQPFWERFVRDSYRSSPALRAYLATYGKWYVEELHRHFEQEQPPKTRA